MKKNKYTIDDIVNNLNKYLNKEVDNLYST